MSQVGDNKIHCLNFVHDDIGTRELVIVKRLYEDVYYRINHGKCHYEDPTKYIAKLFERGWRKVSLGNYLMFKYYRNRKEQA